MDPRGAVKLSPARVGPTSSEGAAALRSMPGGTDQLSLPAPAGSFETACKQTKAKSLLKRFLREGITQKAKIT